MRKKIIGNEIKRNEVICMNKYTCPVCGYSVNGDNPPTSCPKCGVPGEKFIKTVEADIENLIMKIEGSFKVVGKGTVVTGILNAPISVGKFVVINNRQYEIQGIESNKQIIYSANAGMAVGLLLKGSTDTFQNGDSVISAAKAENASKQNHCNSCGGELEKDGNVYVCKQCGEVFKNEYTAEHGNIEVHKESVFPASSTSANMPQTPDDIAYKLLNAGYQDRKVEAIKILREKTGLGLKEAKDVIDRVFASAGYGAYTPAQTQKSSGCYVATCVYGSYNCPQVWTLRRYRDNTLAKTWHGRAFIHTYYAISPTIVKWFGNTTWFKKLWRSKLDKMVRNLNNDGVSNAPYEDRSW